MESEKIFVNGFKHIIWDWNGTLLDDRWLCIDSINRMLLLRDLDTIDETQYSESFGFPVRDYYGKIGFDFEQEEYEVPAMEFISLYDQRKKECQLQPGAREVLNFIFQAGIPQSLLSASESGILVEMTNHFGISTYFKYIKGLDNHLAHGKADLGKELVAALGLDGSSILMIGDTCHDSEVANLLGINSILYCGGHFPEHRLTACGRTIIHRLTDLIPLISSLQILH